MKNDKLKNSETEKNVAEEIISLEKNDEITNNEEKMEEVVIEKNINEDVIQQENSNIYEELKPIKNKGKKGPFIILTIIILALAAILYFVYTNFSNPKKMFVNSINKNYKKIENYIDDSFNDKVTKPMILSSDLKFNIKVDDSLGDSSTKKIIDEINKIKLNAVIGNDQKQKEMLMTIEALYDNKSLIDLGTYAKNEKMYLELKNLFDKYIEMPLENYDAYFTQKNINTSDIKYVLEKTKTAIVDNLEEKNFKKSKSTIKVEGKNIKTTKITYALSQESSKKLSKKAFSTLVKDKKYIEALASLSDTKKEQIKESFEEKIDELTEKIKSDDLDKDEVLLFSVYTKGLMGNVVGYEMTIVSEDDKVIASYYKGKSKDELKVTLSDEEIINASISDNKFVFDVTYNDETINFEVLKKEKSKKTTYSYTLTVSGLSINGDVIVEMIKENKDGTYEANISISASFMGMIEMTISGNSKLEYKDKLDLPDVSNSISIDAMTEEDFNSIKTKFMQNENLMSLITKIDQYAN